MACDTPYWRRSWTASTAGTSWQGVRHRRRELLARPAAAAVRRAGQAGGEGLVAGRQVVQETRPNKRLFQVTEAGRAELEDFAAAVSKPSSIRDDLLVKVQAADRVGTAPVIDQLQERPRRPRARSSCSAGCSGSCAATRTRRSTCATASGSGRTSRVCAACPSSRATGTGACDTVGVLKERRTTRAER